jgi:hypothetical protein
MANHGNRTGRPKGRCLTSAVGLSIVLGLSCSASVTLPGEWAVLDGGGGSGGGSTVPDASRDSARGGNGGSEQCGANAHYQQVGVGPNSVEMIVALDRSSSMETNTLGTTTRLQAAQDAIKKMAGDHPGIRFGLDVFPVSSNSCGLSQLVFKPEFNRLAGTDNLACGSSDAGCLPPGLSDSPSHKALGDSIEYFRSWGASGSWSQVVLLITDRDPICASYPSSTLDICNQMVDLASKFGNAGLFIVALAGDKASTSCLSRVASANNPFYFGNPPDRFSIAPTQDELGKKLGEIAFFVEQSLCRFPLVTQQSHVADNPDQVVVSINNQPVQHVPAAGGEGWSIDHNALILSGSYCDTIKSEQHTPIVTVTTCWSPDAGGSGGGGPRGEPGSGPTGQ